MKRNSGSCAASNGASGPIEEYDDGTRGEVARHLEVPKMLVVVNKAIARRDFVLLREQVHAAYDVPVAGILAETEEMLDLASNGLFCLHYPEHPLTKTMAEIAARVVAE